MTLEILFTRPIWALKAFTALQKGKTTVKPKKLSMDKIL